MIPEDETDDQEDQFSGVLQDLDEVTNNAPQTTVGEIADALGNRGTGPYLVLLSALLILPVGMVPGMPGLVALIMIMIGLQTLLGSARLWLPARIRRISVPSRTLQNLIEKAQPWRHRMRHILSTRFTIVFDSLIVQISVAATLMATGTVIFFIGFVPGLPFVLSIHVLLIGLGLTARDGVVMSLGLAAIAPAVWIVAKVIF